VLPGALAAAAHDEQVTVTPLLKRIVGPPRGRNASMRTAPTEMIATMVSSVQPRPIVSPVQATLSRPSR